MLIFQLLVVEKRIRKVNSSCYALHSPFQSSESHELAAPSFLSYIFVCGPSHCRLGTPLTDFN